MSNTHTSELPSSDRAMRSRLCSNCYLCGRIGTVLYEGLKDRIAKCPGTWQLRRCSFCELLWIDPLPVPEDIGLAYEGYFTHDAAVSKATTAFSGRYERAKYAYLSRKFGYSNPGLSLLDRILSWVLTIIPTRSQYVDATVLHLRCRPGTPRMLDVGCGNGIAMRVLKSLGWEVEGLDFDPVVVQRARDAGLKVRLGMLHEQQYPDATFDAVTLSHVIEHLHDPVAVIRECIRVLKPGGTLVVLTPNANSWGHRKFRDSWLYLDPPRHLFIFTPAALRKTVELGGLEKVVIHTSGGTAPNMYEGSASVAQTGRFTINPERTWVQRLRAEVIDAIAWLLRCIDPLGGEEVVLLGTK